MQLYGFELAFLFEKGHLYFSRKYLNPNNFLYLLIGFDRKHAPFLGITLGLSQLIAKQDFLKYCGK